MYSCKRDKYKQLRAFELTTECDDSQLRHLLDPNELAYAEHNYGRILSRTVLYRGNSCGFSHDVCYCNVSEHLIVCRGKIDRGAYERICRLMRNFL